MVQPRASQLLNTLVDITTASVLKYFSVYFSFIIIYFICTLCF